jgi:hypothetical protein
MFIKNNFAPTKLSEPKSDVTLEINESKLEAVHKMHKIIKSHILMNYMIRWIENGFMHFPTGSISPIIEKDENLEYSAIEKEDDRFLHPITEESFNDINDDNHSSASAQKKNHIFKLVKLRNAIKI